MFNVADCKRNLRFAFQGLDSEERADSCGITRCAALVITQLRCEALHLFSEPQCHRQGTEVGGVAVLTS